MSEGDKNYLTAAEAAAYLGRGASTLARERMTGEGAPFVRVGRAVRYRRSDLDEFMSKHLRTQEAAHNG